MTIIKEILYAFFFLVSTLNYGLSQDCKLKLSGFNQESDVAYLGVNNFIEVESESLQLQTNNGDILIDNNRVIYRPNSIGQAIIISNPKITTEIVARTDTCEVIVKYLPFTFELGHLTTFFKNKIEIEKEDLLNAKFYMRSTNTNLSAHAKILGFNIIIWRNNYKIIEKTYVDYNKENRNNILNLFESLELNDIIVVDKLKYMYLDEHIIEHKQIIIVVD